MKKASVEFNEFQILNNGKVFLSGDKISMNIIFKNIIGENKVNKDYFEFLKNEGAEPGTFTLITPDEKTTKTVNF